MRQLEKPDVRKLKDAIAHVEELVRDEHLRSDVRAAIRHGMVAADRVRKGSGLTGLGDRLVSDVKLRKSFGALLKDLESAGEHVRRKRSHRLRNTLLLLGLGGAVAVVAPRARRWTSGLLSRSPGGLTGMARVEETIEVDVPVSTAYNQWTQFEEFPRFMEGVDVVRQLDDTLLHWAASVAGRRHEWDAKIVEQSPDRRIAWKSVSGKETDGVVSFEPAGKKRTRIHVAMSYRPDAAERVGSALHLDNRRVRGDLDRFKELIEAGGVETGAGKGDVHAGSTES
jgi:uncharacterized membrane protein